MSTVDERVAENNWKVYMGIVHGEMRNSVLRETYSTLCAILPDPLDRSTLATLMVANGVEDWRVMAQFKQEENKGFHDS